MRVQRRHLRRPDRGARHRPGLGRPLQPARPRARRSTSPACPTASTGSTPSPTRTTTSSSPTGRTTPPTSRSGSSAHGHAGQPAGVAGLVRDRPVGVRRRRRARSRPRRSPRARRTSCSSPSSSSDGPADTPQTATVTGGGLTWTLAKRTNTQAGTAEVWTAMAPPPLTNAVITSTTSSGGYVQSLTVYAIKGASGIGATASASGGQRRGHRASLTTTKRRLLGHGRRQRSRPLDPALAQPGPVRWLRQGTSTDRPCIAISPARIARPPRGHHQNEPARSCPTRLCLLLAGAGVRSESISSD